METTTGQFGMQKNAFCEQAETPYHQATQVSQEVAVTSQVLTENPEAIIIQKSIVCEKKYIIQEKLIIPKEIVQKETHSNDTEKCSQESMELGTQESLMELGSQDSSMEVSCSQTDPSEENADSSLVKDLTVQCVVKTGSYHPKLELKDIVPIKRKADDSFFEDSQELFNDSNPDTDLLEQATCDKQEIVNKGKENIHDNCENDAKGEQGLKRRKSVI